MYFVQFKSQIKGVRAGRWFVSQIIQPQATAEKAKSEVERLKSMGSTLELRVIDETGKVVE